MVKYKTAAYLRLSKEEFIKKELNITEITRLNIDNNINYISVISNNEIEIIKTDGSDK